MKTFLISLKIFLFFTILTGMVYPLFVTGIAQFIFPIEANGSLIVRNNKILGSELVGQQFDSTIYFMSRPSAISNNPLPSGGSNYGLINGKLLKLVNERRIKFNVFNELDSLTTVPSEMLFASASGIDPHVSAEAALLQVSRIAEARNFSDSQKLQLMLLVKDMTEEPQFLFLGETRLNVLKLNLALDDIQ